MRFNSNYAYINGNYLVSYNASSDRLVKRALRFNEELLPEFPDSIDLKITNKCSWGCPWCHENSNLNGKSFNLQLTKLCLSQLPKVGIEIAIGGGNVLDCPEETLDLINWLNSNSFNPRITINYKDLNRFDFNSKNINVDIVSKLDSIGISISEFPEDFNETCNLLSGCVRTKVYHVIAGVFPVDDLKKLFSKGVPILILGYKQWGRAINTELPDMTDWKQAIGELLLEQRKKYSSITSTIGFDNLALEQLDIKNKLLPKEWEALYMGPEFSHSMYIDAVEGVFAPTSRDPNRVSWDSIGIVEYFQKYRQGWMQKY